MNTECSQGAASLDTMGTARDTMRGRASWDRQTLKLLQGGRELGSNNEDDKKTMAKYIERVRCGGRFGIVPR